MPKIVVRAAVKDVEAWLKLKLDLVAQVSAVASDGTSFVAMDGSNRVATRSRVTSGSDDTCQRQARRRGSVIGPPVSPASGDGAAS